jgi:signal transduction histidine kinase
MFGPRVGTEIRVVAREDPEGWRFYIKSEGRAIAPEDRERIFEPYRRGRDERRTRGTGLGLAICREIVSWHGGSMGVRATDGRYNAFGSPCRRVRPARPPAGSASRAG